MKKCLLLIALLFVFTNFSFAQSDDECMACHEDQTLTMQKNGRNVPLGVKKNTLKNSAHSKLKCVSCHEGFKADDIPHKKNITRVDCFKCHSNAASLHKFHPKMAKYSKADVENKQFNCKNCHGAHDVISPKLPQSRMHFTKTNDFCGICHTYEKNEHSQSEHNVQLNKSNPNAPTCIYCHKEPITKGHSQNQAQLKLNQEKLCLSCHIKNSSGSSFSQKLVEYEKSVHGSAIQKGNANAAVCVDCHGEHNLTKSDAPNSRINQFNISQVCGKCHIAITQEYNSSVHGVALKKGNKDVPGCSYCHGEHSIQAKPLVSEKVFEKGHLQKTLMSDTKMIYCVECHTNDTLMKKYNISTFDKAHDWLPSQKAHYETVRCVDCHSSYLPPNLSHNILPPDQTIKKCEECHTKNSALMDKLYRHEKEQAREKYGFINGTLLSDAYVIGATRNLYVDIFSFILFGLILFGVLLHAFLRWYFHKGDAKK